MYKIYTANMKQIISISEAREILGEVAVGMTDEDIEETINTLDLLAKDALKLAREELARKKDAKAMAHLIYDIYQDKKRHEKSQQ